MKRVKDLIWSGGVSRVWDKWPADGTVTLSPWKYKRLTTNVGWKKWLKNNKGVIMVRIDTEFRCTVHCSNVQKTHWVQFTGQVTRMDSGVLCHRNPHIIYFQRCHILTSQVFLFFFFLKFLHLHSVSCLCDMHWCVCSDTGSSMVPL